jgi:sugar lactone lactonase YvrE
MKRIIVFLAACGGGDGFGAPTDIAFLSNGEVVISDGYDNARIARYADGEIARTWGTHGCGEGELDIPHGIAVDDADRIYVADRNNARIQIFDREGALLDVWEGPEIGRPWGLEIRDGLLVVVDGGDQIADAPFGRVTAYDLDGNVVATFGDGDDPVIDGHDVAIDSQGAVYVGSLSGRRLRKFVPR